ncbi:DUF4360 domain-containing protein [Actinomadura litoris]|uniref:DUF4360 domain-containing protein n=1 Tax=Actinomadura litoris TaxID=2678616 RepID=UPI001FA755D2|nr:DUF4360 domain-containing protein [Actinomadura litoris]
MAVATLAVTAMPAGAGSRLVRGPSKVIIDITSATGSGCSPDTVEVELKASSDPFSIGYARYVAQAGGPSSPTDSHKNCEVGLRVRFPHRFVYAVSQVRYRGYANLMNGASALHKGSFYLQGATDGSVITHKVPSGPRGSWMFTDTVPDPQLVWTRCGEERLLYLRTELQLDQGTSDPKKASIVSMNSLGETPGTTYQLVWKECP